MEPYSVGSTRTINTVDFHACIIKSNFFTYIIFPTQYDNIWDNFIHVISIAIYTKNNEGSVSVLYLLFKHICLNLSTSHRWPPPSIFSHEKSNEAYFFLFQKHLHTVSIFHLFQQFPKCRLN